MESKIRVTPRLDHFYYSGHSVSLSLRTEDWYMVLGGADGPESGYPMDLQQYSRPPEVVRYSNLYYRHRPASGTYTVTEVCLDIFYDPYLPAGAGNCRPPRPGEVASLTVP